MKISIIIATGDGIDGGAAGISAGRADDGQAAAFPARQELPRTSRPSNLQCDILEGERGAMKQLQQPVLR